MMDDGRRGDELLSGVTKFAQLDANFSLIKEKLARWDTRYGKQDEIPQETLRLFVDQLRGYLEVLEHEEHETRKKIDTA